jgi:hypothetical protein
MNLTELLRDHLLDVSVALLCLAWSTTARVRGEQRTDSSTCVARRNAESNSDSDSDADQEKEKTGFLRHLYIK